MITEVGEKDGELPTRSSDSDSLRRILLIKLKGR